MERVVMDTSVLVAALRSNKGASFRMLSLIGTGSFELAVSVPLVLEYEDAAKRSVPESLFDYVDDIIDYICAVGTRREVFYLWRPLLKDPGDDHVLELAVESLSTTIVTYNKKDFAKAAEFGLSAETALEFLERKGLL
jgi:predicted nucleic acid-binding protein